jgi:hypothetical protein
MKDYRKAVEEIRSRSIERPQRLVIDEVFPDGWFRILSAEMRSSKEEAEALDSAAWGNEKELYINEKQLGELLSEKQIAKVSEGQVFRIKQRRAKNIQEEVKEHVKTKTKTLLAREGKTVYEVETPR